jgi:hypothetical protein
MFLLASPAGAQSMAAIVGTVRDPSGAAVPGATVVVANVGTGLSQTRTTTGEGAFSFPLLPVGEYTLQVEAPGLPDFSAISAQASRWP